jgi:hypothetical protein
VKRNLKLCTSVAPLPELERLFRDRTKGWLGGDCAFSTPLDGKRILWLFGDSFVSADPEAGSRVGSHIVANSIAIQTGQTVRFWWGRDGAGAAAFFSSPALPGRSWPLSAIRLGDRVAVFAVRVVTVNPNQVTGFRIVGHEIYWVENPDAEPDKWEVAHQALPWSEQTGTFGSWLLAHDGYVYVYGFRRRFRSWFREVQTLVARVPLDRPHALADPGMWEYLQGERMRWSRDPAALCPVVKQGATEFSVSYLPGLAQFVMVAGSPRRHNAVQLRVADTPYGPFSKAQTVFLCPEAEHNSRYFCYAAKAHPELAAKPSELVVSYAVNSRRLEDCFLDQGIYFPRFLRISFQPQGREIDGEGAHR